MDSEASKMNSEHTFEQYVDQLCNEMSLKIEDMRRFFKAGAKNDSSVIVTNGRATSDSSYRERALEVAIQEAVVKLESTKNSFKSRKVKEVRESLTRVITGQGHFSYQLGADK